MQTREADRAASRVVTLIVLFALLVGCTSSDPVDDLSAAADWLGVNVPPSAQDFQFSSVSGGIDDSALIRFDLPASEFEPFVSTLNLGRELSPGRHGFPSFTDPAWMDTSGLTDFVGAPSTGRTPSVQVTADVSSADTVTVYILAFDV